MVHKQKVGLNPTYICHFSSENGWAIWSRQRERGFANTCRQHQQKNTHEHEGGYKRICSSPQI